MHQRDGSRRDVWIEYLQISDGSDSQRVFCACRDGKHRQSQYRTTKNAQNGRCHSFLSPALYACLLAKINAVNGAILRVSAMAQRRELSLALVAFVTWPTGTGAPAGHT